MDDKESELLEKASNVREKNALRKNVSRLLKKSLKNRAVIPRTRTRRRMSDMESHLSSLGLDHSVISTHVQTNLSRSQLATSGEDVVMRDAGETDLTDASTKRPVSGGLKNVGAMEKVERIKRSKQIKRNREARQGEGDKRVTETKPKHMYVGKRKMGKTNRR
jgi:nucleolar GTP-binding protein